MPTVEWSVGYGLGNWRVVCFLAKGRDFLFSTFQTNLWPTRPPIQWVLATILSGIKWQGLRLTPSATVVKNECRHTCNQWRTEGVVWNVQNPPLPEIPKALQNHAKLNPICENCYKIAEFRTPTPQDVQKKGSKILKLPRFAIVLHYQWQINWLSS